jgi:hypothetical protein
LVYPGVQYGSTAVQEVGTVNLTSRVLGKSVAAEELGATVENFASRLKRQLKEQEVAQSESAKASQARQALLLKAMTGVRKALQEASKISLGERFSFDLDISDWEGWPRLELRLVDSAAPDLLTQSLIATAHDRNEQGTLQLTMRSGEILGTVHLRDENEYSRLPLLLKKGLRTFLDVVSDAVLNPTNVADTVAGQTQALEGTEEDTTGQSLGDEDVFSEELYTPDSNRAEIIDDPGLQFALTAKV